MEEEMKKYDEGIPDGHAFQETRDWHRTDQVLRRNGFKVHARPKGKMAQWRLGNNIFDEAEAIDYINRQK